MLTILRQQVYEANMELKSKGLVIYSSGNVSGIERETGFVVAKPAGIGYDELTPEKMVVVDLEGKLIEGRFKPANDLLTHLELYKSFVKTGGIVNTQSIWATAWSQAGMGIPCYGTLHADFFYGEIPCTRPLLPTEINDDYEKNIGKIVVEFFEKNQINYEHVPATLIPSHTPIVWGKTPNEAAQNSFVLEEVAKMALITKLLDPDLREVSLSLMDRHFAKKK